MIDRLSNPDSPASEIVRLKKRLAEWLKAVSKGRHFREKKSLSKIPFYPGIWVKSVEKILRKNIKYKRCYDPPESKEDAIKVALRNLATLEWPKFFPRRPKGFKAKLKSLATDNTLIKGNPNIKGLIDMDSNQERALKIVARLHDISLGRLRYWVNEERKVKRSVYDKLHGRPVLFSTPHSADDVTRLLKYQEVKF